MSVVKVIEVLTESPTSWEDAAQKAITQAGKTVKNIKSAYVKEMSTRIENGKIVGFRVNLKLSFEIQGA